MKFIWDGCFESEIDEYHKVVVQDLNRFYTDVPKIEKIEYTKVRDFVYNYLVYSTNLVEQCGMTSVEDVETFVLKELKTPRP